jgi:hypothetical protein
MSRAPRCAGLAYRLPPELRAERISIPGEICYVVFRSNEWGPQAVSPTFSYVRIVRVSFFLACFLTSNYVLPRSGWGVTSGARMQRKHVTL